MKTWLRWSLALAIATGLTQAARADDVLDTPRTRTELYFGALIPYNAVGGDLKGDRFYGNVDGVATVPDVDPGLGLGLVFGLKGNRPSGRAIALEASVQGTKHDSEFAGLKRDVELGLLSLDFKFFPTTGGAVEPWLQLGLCAASLTVKDGFFNASGGTRDETYTGSGVNLGAGLIKYLSPRVALHLAAIYRFIRYDEVDYDRRAELSEDLSGNMLSLEMGLTFRFSRG